MEHFQSEYRPINLDFLTRNENQRFEIFYRSRQEKNRFLKFAGTDPAHQEKFFKLIESGEAQEQFYIHERDMFKYYDQVTRSLREFVTDDKVPVQEKTGKIYSVSKDIMKEFFDLNASPKILHTSEEVMEMMETCMSDESFGFYALTQITNKDYYTYSHSVNVGLYCMTYGVKTKMGLNDTRDLGIGGMFHDIGKSKIPAEIINKDGSLTEEEFELIKKHPVYGEGILKEMDCYQDRVIDMVRDHHERYEGNGYPNGSKGDDVTLFARICKIMDVYDALTTRRSYKKAMIPIEALVLMKREMSGHFDPKLVDNFIQLMGPQGGN